MEGPFRSRSRHLLATFWRYFELFNVGSTSVNQGFKSFSNKALKLFAI